MTNRADLAIAKRAFKQCRIGATVCAVAFGATAASSALSYVSSFPTAASRHQIAVTTGRDAGLAVLLGPVSAIGTVGGYTFYKVFVFLTTIGALWALLAATRLLRGEEDAGRWQLVLAGGTRPARAVAATLTALGAGVGVIFLGTTLITMLAGRNPDLGFGAGETFLFGLSIVTPAAVFVGVGAVAAQLGRTRRVSTGLGVIVFGVAFVLRMIGDAGSGTRWLLWATPFGWSELMRPLTRNDLDPLVAAFAAVVALCGVAVWLVARRDAGAGVLASRDVTRLRPFGLGSTFGLTVRRELPALSAWLVGALATGVMFGVIAKVTVTTTSDALNKTLQKFDVHGSLAKQYLGIAFLLVGTIVALLPAGQMGAAGEEETTGRLVNVLARATRRTEWFVGRVALTGAAVIGAAVLAGFGAWLGAKTQGVHLALSTMLGAGLNVVPTALVALGVGAVTLSLAPRAASGAVYFVIAWSLVIDLSASFVARFHWLEHLSLYHYMALAPASSIDPSTLAITTGVALALCVVATFMFRRRDLNMS